jgi:hypothetical protein
MFAVKKDARQVQYAVLPVWDVLEAAPHDLAAHGEANEVKLRTKLQVVGELLDVKGDALLTPGRVWIALSIPRPVERQKVDAQLLCHLLHQISDNNMTITSCQGSIFFSL